MFSVGDIINESLFFAKYFKDEFILITSFTQQVIVHHIFFWTPNLTTYVEQDVASFNDESNAMIKTILMVLLQPFLESFYIILYIIAMVNLSSVYCLIWSFIPGKKLFLFRDFQP